MRLASYCRHQYRFSYLRTINDIEVDLIIERPGKPTVYIEIKSTNKVTSDMLTYFQKMVADAGTVEGFCFSNDPYAKQFGSILALPWQEGIRKIFHNVENNVF